MSEASGSAPTPTLPRRRNGKQQSCEPCRKAKIACDHALPTCGRCKRRKMAERCVYLAAPMTKPVLDGQTRSEPSILGGGGHERTRSEPSLGSGGMGARDGNGNGNGDGGESREQQNGMGNRSGKFPLTPNTGSTASPVGGLSQLSETSAVRPAAVSGPFIKSGGFFGPTNFSAVFHENRENLGSSYQVEISNDSDQPTFTSPSASLQSQTFLMLASPQTRGSPRIALGTKVLLALPDHTTCQFLLQRYYDKSHEAAYPKEAVVDIAKTLWMTFGKELAEPRIPEEVETVSAILCKNAESALEEFEEYDRWLASCSGRNLRWESLGFICGAMCTAVLSLPDRDPFFQTQKGDRRVRRNFSVEIKDWVQACITLSNYMDLINVGMVALLGKNLILSTVINGDASLVVWRQLGDLINATTALGLHRQADPERITFMSETKKRIFTCIFHIDKSTSLLLGRPPALAYRYCRWRLPLDIKDEVLMRGGEELQRAIARLDADGWNTDGYISAMTTCRAFGRLSPVLDEVLEISLGNPEECTGDRIQYLMDKTAAVYASSPSWLKFKMSDLYSPTCSDETFWRRLCLRLFTLEHRLLLERLAHKQGALDGQSMVDCAREMLELTVLIWVQRDRFVEHHHDYDWMLMCWGIPSSGVLCVELLKQMKQGSQLKLPRSEIVQNLSLLIGFLEWVKPAAGNYQLCMRMRIIIKKILEQILNPSPPSSAPTSTQESLGSTGNGGSNGQTYEPGAGAGGAVVSYDPSLFEPGNWDGDMDNLDWLNNMDWSRGPWFDLGQDFSAVRWN